MAAGDILKTTGLVVESFTVKENEDIEKGELVVNDGNGILAATEALAIVGKVLMALENHDYSEETEHKVDCVVHGYVEAQKVSGSGAAKKGQKLMISVTAGECTLFVKGDATATVNQTTVNAALDKNAGTFGAAAADSVDADTTQKLWL